MDGETQSTSDHSRTSWTPPMDRYLIDLLLDQVRRGNKIGHLFNKQAWTDMVGLFNDKFGPQYDEDVLKNQHNSLRKQYNDIVTLLGQSGFTWDERRQTVAANDYVWDDYLKAHPDSRLYKTKIVPYYNDLCIIYGHAIADGRYSLSSHDMDLGSEGKRTDTQLTISGDCSKIDWTMTMDHYFVELMKDQVHKGNKIGHIFKKKAWVQMIASFNENFGFQYEKDVLKNRYKNLRRQYNNIKILLGQSGFSLDETQQMVIADNCVWDDYIKAHPNARVFRNRVIPYYSDLCMIYGDTTTDIKFNHLDQGGELDNIVNVQSVVTPGGQHSQAMPVAQGGLMHSSRNFDTLDQQNKRRSEIPSTYQHSRKSRRCLHNDMMEALHKMAMAITSLTNKKEIDNSFSTENVIGLLQAVPDMDEELLLDACDILEDETNAKIFLALDATLRKKWLIRKLRSW
ncbi:PREDICTED: L10-interacting MYB domain-containing protein-like isoform X2 [Nelumbo nucifera]|uniref:Myb/SANT-like domain-containing protein n=2 Tax=Nelumbo nucifera TaxID=4432 RepID=A0A822XZU4_NELNU|nr:PREDICTED: L10-interacting MYB domain-containing protein-like isoform X2 [Nelumbo nucifera]DAD24526.1 TPA_asm: hypothetical protein HUJ06_025990 [Nelumbo nucifera]